jgi:cytoskeletal protein RodZ
MFGRVPLWGRLILLLSSISLIHPSYLWSFLGLLGVLLMAVYQYFQLPVGERLQFLKKTATSKNAVLASDANTPKMKRRESK